jgi:hypothetical protein
MSHSSRSNAAGLQPYLDVKYGFLLHYCSASLAVPSLMNYNALVSPQDCYHFEVSVISAIIRVATSFACALGGRCKAIHDCRCIDKVRCLCGEGRRDFYLLCTSHVRPPINHTGPRGHPVSLPDPS